MKPGEVAGPIDKENHIFIMQLVEYQPKSVEPFEKVQNQVKADITVERMSKAFAKSMTSFCSRPRRRTGPDSSIFA